MNKITKISKLDFTNSFLQINYNKGFKYIDKAGELINNYYENGREPHFQMSLGQTEITLSKKTVKVGSNMFWVNYINPNSIENIRDTGKKEFKKVYNLFELTELTKIGWRNHFVYKFNGTESKSNRDVLFEKIKFENKLKFESGTFSMSIDNIKIIFNINKILLKNNDLNDYGVLFDIDLIKNITSYNDLEDTLIKMKKILHSDNILNILNSFLDKNV